MLNLPPINPAKAYLSFLNSPSWYGLTVSLLVLLLCASGLLGKIIRIIPLVPHKKKVLIYSHFQSLLRDGVSRVWR